MGNTHLICGPRYLVSGVCRLTSSSVTPPGSTLESLFYCWGWTSHELVVTTNPKKRLLVGFQTSYINTNTYKVVPRWITKKQTQKIKRIPRSLMISTGGGDVHLVDDLARNLCGYKRGRSSWKYNDGVESSPFPTSRIWRCRT